MVKRTKKPPIKPEVRRDWLRRNEESDESPPQIAAKDGFDIRTVRKQIELAKQEREVREARSTVLRNALERHYDDLRHYAEMLNSQLGGGSRVEPHPDTEFLEAALRQHLPRSPLWGFQSKLMNLHHEMPEQKQKVNAWIEQAVNVDSRLTALASAGLTRVIPGIVEALKVKADQWSHREEWFNLKDNLLSESVGEGQVNLHYGAFYLIERMDAQLAEGYLKIVREALEDLESHLRESQELLAFEKTVTEIARAERKFREELAVIRLRRIVPGRCKYCPL